MATDVPCRVTLSQGIVEKKGSASVKGGTGVASKQIRILIADDHAVYRQGLALLLQSQNKRLAVVAEAENGEEAVRKAQELVPDAVILDTAMPVMDGAAAAARIRAALPSIGVLFLTDHEEPAASRGNAVHQLPGSGAVGWIPKQATAAEMAAAIDTVTAGYVYLHSSILGGLRKACQQRHSDGEGLQSGRRGSVSLTAREREVLTLVAEGKRNREIAEALGISVKTVETHRARIMEKLCAHDRVQLVRYAIREGLIQA